MSESHTLLGLSLKIEQLLLQNRSIEHMLTDCCEIIAHNSQFNTAWIGMLSDDRTRFDSVQFGQQSEFSYLKDTLPAFVLNRSLQSLGMAGRCVLESQPLVINDLQNEISLFSPWQEHFSTSQVKSVLALPLKLHPSLKPSGCLMMTANKEGVCVSEVLYIFKAISFNISQAIVLNKEILYQKRTEILLEHERMLLKNLINSMPDLIFYKDFQGVYLGANSAYVKFSGRTEEQIIGMTDFDFVSRERAEFIREQDQKMLAGKTKRSTEEWVDYPDGSRVLLHTLKTPILDLNNKILGIIGVSRDITEQYRINAQLTASEARLQKVLSGASLGYWDWNYQTDQYDVNQQWLDIIGLKGSDVKQQISDWEERLHVEDKEITIELIVRAIELKQSFHAEYRMKHKLGHWVWIECAGSVVEWNTNGQPLRLCGTHQNITQRKRAEVLLSENEQRFRELLDSMPNIAIQGYDKNRNVIYWNQASEKLYGYSRKEVSEKKLEELIIPDEMKKSVVEGIRQWHENGIAIPAGELLLKKKSGDVVPVHSNHVMLKHPGGDSEMFCIDIDLSEQKAAQQQLEQMANFDQLTHLPNRSLFLGRFEQALNEAKRFQTIIAVIFIDLDNFKYINDTLGHDVGDVLLVQVAHRLSYSLRKYDLISRFGGDEFVIALPHLDKEQIIVSLVEKLKAQFDYPFELEGQSSYVSCSMGISFYPDSGDSTSSLLKYADMAMYKAKEAGRNQFLFFNENINHKVNRHIELLGRLKHALEKQELSLLYQPQINMDSGELVGCEALLRWHNKDLGEVSRLEFIPVAEQSRLINKIDYWVLETIQHDIKDWIASGKRPVRVFANISERGFSDNKFLARLKQFVQNNRLFTRYFGIELTEKVLLKAGEQSKQLLALLHEHGISLVLDKFGMGYSSIRHLKDSPIDRIKIDKIFIERAALDGHEAPYVNAIIAMSQNLNIKIVAVGIEEKHQRQFIEQTQCDIVQGFIYHKPMNAQSLKELLKPAD